MKTEMMCLDGDGMKTEMGLAGRDEETSFISMFSVISIISAAKSSYLTLEL
jgi:hypothetical protein